MYPLLVYLHLASVAVWVGGDVLLTVQTVRLTRGGDDRGAGMLARLDAAGAVVMPPAALGAFATGLGLIVTTGVGFGALWVQVGIAGVVASTVLADVFTRCASLRFVASAEQGAGPDLAAARRHLIALSVANVVLLAGVMAAMVFKPTG